MCQAQGLPGVRTAQRLISESTTFRLPYLLPSSDEDVGSVAVYCFACLLVYLMKNTASLRGILTLILLMVGLHRNSCVDSSSFKLASVLGACTKVYRHFH